MLIEIPAADGTAEALVARPSTGAGPFPGVILYMDAFGLRPRIQDMAQRIADWGYIVLAPNVFYREGTAAELAPESDMSTQEGREAAGAAAFPRVGRLTTDKALPSASTHAAMSGSALSVVRRPTRGNAAAPAASRPSWVLMSDSGASSAAVPSR